MKKRINISLDPQLHEKGHAWSRAKRITFSKLLETLLNDLGDVKASPKKENTLTVNEPQSTYLSPITHSLFAKISQLPAYQQQHLDVYTDFLLSKVEHPLKKRLPPGMLKGGIFMSQDFDEPLADFDDYG